MAAFPNDIFISYSHRDNLTIPGAKGWMDKFHALLQVRLSIHLGRDPVIWRDGKLTGGDFFDDEIRDNLLGSKLLLCVLSPSYLNSKYCGLERDEFFKAADQSLGRRIGNRSRCVKVIKTYIERDAHPPEMQGLLGYELCDFNKEEDRPREYSQDAQGYQYQAYLDLVDKLAWNLSETLNAIKTAAPAPKLALAETSHKGIVYLAEATADRQTDRKQVQSELASRGYRVVPAEPLPRDSAEGYCEAVRAHLQEAKLSIHLIGETYGSIPDGEEEKSIIYLQNELAAEQSAQAALARLIWLPKDLQPKGEKQTRFLDYLQTNGVAQQGAELLQRSLTDLLNRIIEKLVPPKAAVPKPATGLVDELVRIYLICDKLDFPTLKPLEDYLFDKGYEVVPTLNEGDEQQVIQYHKEMLLECDAALLYYGQGNEFWLRMKLADMTRKVRGWGRTRAFLARAIYLAAPEQDAKQRFRTLEATLLPPAFNGFSVAALDRFLAELESARNELAQTGATSLGGAQ
ncbi:MAG: toll/interleukin-1 receptor domain-containing protein [Acidobacteria bacterium]|nr:toll/interleukin-1 receptor domain-containing protein [Acidobacteriota bacterium]MBI3426734.1 toll/interleukin-1 receptor domain-containing protein [Acidobacteriota bacterium]